MQASRLERATLIARRINGPVVVMDEASEPVVVVPLNQYEEMIGVAPRKSLTQAPGSATINRDIALENPNAAASGQSFGSGVSEAEGADEQYYMEPLE